MQRSRIQLAGLVLGDAAVLGAVHPSWRATIQGVGNPDRWLDAGPDLAVAQLCSVLLWLAALWIALGLCAGIGTRLPGAAGRACRRCARLVLPRVAMRVILGSTGLGLLAAPAAHAVTPAQSVAPARPVVASTWVQPSASSWVGDERPVNPRVDPVAPPTWPSSSPPTRTVPAPVLPTSAPPTTRTTPTHRHDPAPRHDPAYASATQARVRAGDSLWLLAAHRLGPHAPAHDVARYWQQVYAANRAAIGDDPSVIHPGQLLHLPAPVQESS